MTPTLAASHIEVIGKLLSRALLLSDTLFARLFDVMASILAVCRLKLTRSGVDRPNRWSDAFTVLESPSYCQGNPLPMSQCASWRNCDGIIRAEGIPVCLDVFFYTSKKTARKQQLTEPVM
jgi:hypothetical protein